MITIIAKVMDSCLLQNIIISLQAPHCLCNLKFLKHFINLSFTFFFMEFWKELIPTDISICTAEHQINKVKYSIFSI